MVDGACQWPDPRVYCLVCKLVSASGVFNITMDMATS